MIEEIELHDWNVTNLTTNKDKSIKSISSYYLDKWYNKIKDYTFDTIIYPINDNIEASCPDILPFAKCMVRYENKSPKDSEFWGPVTTKNQLVKIFYTSLRCKTNQGKKLCIRRWQDNFGNEYRCFYNRLLVAVASTNDTDPPYEEILSYVGKIAHIIPYYRCVFDIVKIKSDHGLEEYKIVEFNSWETNSGAHPFDWIDDTDIFYPEQNSDQVMFKWIGGSKIIYVKQNIKEITSEYIGIPLTNKPDNLMILQPTKPSNWLITDKFLYVTNDIYLGRFDHNLQPINWKRGNFRFSQLQECTDNKILIDGTYYHYDLTCMKGKKYDVINKNSQDNYPEHDILRYGFYCKFGDRFAFCRMDYNGKFFLVNI